VKRRHSGQGGDRGGNRDLALVRANRDLALVRAQAALACRTFCCPRCCPRGPAAAGPFGRIAPRVSAARRSFGPALRRERFHSSHTTVSRDAFNRHGHHFCGSNKQQQRFSVSSARANSFVIGTAVINTHTLPGGLDPRLLSVSR
jgi:hypothetical protein